VGDFSKGRFIFKNILSSIPSPVLQAKVLGVPTPSTNTDKGEQTEK
jgi:hypothetical protein